MKGEAIKTGDADEDIVLSEIRASVDRLVELGRSEGCDSHRIREIVMQSMRVAYEQHTDPYRHETILAVYARSLDSHLGTSPS